MMSALERRLVILYEYPLNERIRAYLRLHQLFNRLGQLIARSEALDHHFALTTLFEIIEVASRSELKSDVLKDLERQKQLYNGYRGNPAISEKALDGLIAQLDEHFESLNQVTGKIGQSLNDNDFLMALRSGHGCIGSTATKFAPRADISVAAPENRSCFGHHPRNQLQPFAGGDSVDATTR